MIAAVLCVGPLRALAQDAPDTQSVGPLPSQSRAPIERKAADADKPQQDEPPAQAALPPMAAYDKAILEKPIASADLEFLKQFDGAPSGDLWKDKQFKGVVRHEIPGVMYHYGRDMSLPEAMENAIGGSKVPVRIRDGRFVLVSGRSALFPGLYGQGFVWVDMQDGIVLGGFYFHPTNGEPTPAVTVFSKQIQEDAISMGQLPPDFARDMSQWSMQMGVPMVTTRYFIGDVNRKILLEHDEDFCAPVDGNYGPAGTDCEQMDSDAADVDMNAAYYLDQVGYATNATARMIVGSDEASFIQVRDNRCGSVADPVACRVRVTREHTHGMVRRGPMWKPRR